MNISTTKTIVIAVVAFLGGAVASNLPSAIAAGSAEPDISKRKFSVSVDEIKQNLVFGEEFSGSYTNSFILSDGSKREIELTPMVHKGMQLVRLKDSGHLSYMGPNGTTTNGTLMVQLREMDPAMEAVNSQRAN